MEEKQKTLYATLSKNHCHRSLVSPPTKDVGFGVIEMDRVYGIFNGMNLYEDELSGETRGWDHVTGYTTKAIRELKEKYPDVKPKFGRGLTRFDATLLLGLLGNVQHNINIEKKEDREMRLAKDYRLYFPSIYALGKFLGLPNTSTYHKRLRESLIKLAASSCWFNGTYYDWKEKKVLENKIIVFKFIDYMKLDKETGEIEVDLSPRWVESQEGYTVRVYFDEIRMWKSEIDLNLMLMFRAWDDKPVKREILELCEGLGFNKDIPKTQMRRCLKSSLKRINKDCGLKYLLKFKKGEKNREIVSLAKQTFEQLMDEERKEQGVAESVIKAKFARHLSKDSDEGAGEFVTKARFMENASWDEVAKKTTSW